MEKSTASINNAFFPFFCLMLFFFNSVFFGGKITLILILTPLWFYLCQPSKAGMNQGVVIAFIILLCYIPIHFYFGVASSWDYIRSLLVLFSLLLFINVAIYYLKKESQQLDQIFRKILIANAILALLSIIFLYIPAIKNTVWYIMSISEDIAPMPRLKLFTPEASHYSYIISPLFIYFSVRWMFCKVQKPLLMLLMAIFPLVLSFSLGVLGALIISFIFLLLFKYKQWFRQILPPTKLLFTFISIAVGLALIYYFYPDNPVYVRLENLLEGKDTSGRGRTYEAFILADKIAALKSEFLGIGPGQLKIIGRNTIVQYYYYMNIPEVVRIPNASAETIVWYGYFGLAIRLILQFWLFFKTRVWVNPFRLWLFLFAFLYQFTGSYITNGYEYILWILVFSPIFNDLNLTKKLVK